jgi:hypothetical protein
MERDKMTDAEWKEINNRCEFVYNDFRVRDAIDAMLVQRPEAPAETSCDNSSGKKVISVPSCVPAESTFTVDQFAAKEREIERLTAQVERLSAPVSDKDAMQLVNWAGLYGLAKVLNNWIAARAAEKGV